MQGVTQTIVVGDGSGRPGNCLQAATATCLGLRLDEVPHFAEIEGNWLGNLREFFEEHGYRMRTEEPTTLGVQFGQSSRGVRHAVAIVDGQVWDPHPSREGLLAVDSEFALVPIGTDPQSCM